MPVSAVIANPNASVLDLIVTDSPDFTGIHGTITGVGPVTVGGWYSLPHLKGCAAVLGPRGFRAIEIREPDVETALQKVLVLANVVPDEPFTGEPTAFRSLREGLDRYAAGRTQAFPRVQLDLSCGTPFRQAVWEELMKIPYGETRSYGDVAAAIGKPGAARAVGSACGANPLPPVVPCHRVLAGGNRLGGFSGEMDWKRYLLRLEGVTWRE